MVVVMVSLSGLLTLGTVTLLQVHRGLQASAQDRQYSVSLFAAESGVSAGMDFLRRNESPSNHFGDFVSPSNQSPQSPAGIEGSGVAPGQPGSLFSADGTSWYEVSILNNTDDVNFAVGGDSDGIVILRSVGHGANGSQVTIEVEVSGSSSSVGGRPCPGYAQRGLSEDGSGRNDCLTDIDSSIVSIFTPGG